MRNVKIYLGLVGLVCGIIAMIIALSYNSGGLLYETETLTIKEKGISILKDKLGLESQRPSRGLKIDHVGVFLLSLIAVIASLMGLFIKTKKSDIGDSLLGYFNINGAGLCFGIVALLWSYILIALVIAVVVYVLVNAAGAFSV